MNEFVFSISILLRFPPLPSYLSALGCLLIFAWIFIITTEKFPVGILWGLGWMAFPAPCQPPGGLAFVSDRCLVALLVWHHFDLNLPLKVFWTTQVTWIRAAVLHTGTSWWVQVLMDYAPVPPYVHFPCQGHCPCSLSGWEVGWFWFTVIFRGWLLGNSA